MNKPNTRAWWCSVLFACASVHAQSVDADLVKRGEYLAIAGDCLACHSNTKQGGLPYAGGYAVASPIGKIYATNITPSKQYGIGNYSLEQFSNAVRLGIRADGSHLYPAMPYTAYAKINDDDIKAMYAYFMHGVQPVDTAATAQTQLGFPTNIRRSMAVWNGLYFDHTPFTPQTDKSSVWNRGAYLVQGLAHCSTCHTPRNALMAEDTDQMLAGAALGAWYAPNITSDKVAGIGKWSAEELYAYLKTGHAQGKAQAAGPMAEAVENSFQHMSDGDIKAMVAYLQDVPATNNTSTGKARHEQGQAFNVDLQLRGADAQTSVDSVATGAALFSGYCASCHQANGSGSADQAYPSLYHNTVTGADRPNNLIATILFGVERTVAGKEVRMPHFGKGSYVGELSDDEVAKIANFVFEKYGNPQLAVSAQDVALMRVGGEKPLLAKLQPFALPALVALAMLLLLYVTRRRRPKR